MTGGLDRQNKPLGDVWILDIERGNWRKVRLNFTLCVVYIHIIKRKERLTPPVTSASAFETLACKCFCPYLAQPVR